MDPSGDSTRSLDTGISEESPEVGSLLASWSKEQKWEVVHHLMRELLHDDPREEVALSDPDGTVYAFVVRVRARFGLVECSADEWANLDASVLRDIGPAIPVDAVLKVLEASANPADAADRLERLAVSIR